MCAIHTVLCSRTILSHAIYPDPTLYTYTVLLMVYENFVITLVHRTFNNGGEN